MEYARDMVATGRVGVNQACRLLGLSKKSYYRSISPDESLEARSFSELEAYVKKAIDYYNNSRYHSSIGMTSPTAFTLQQMVELTNSHRKAVS